MTVCCKCPIVAFVFYNCAINAITQGTVTNELNADHRAMKQYSTNIGGSIAYRNK